MKRNEFEISNGNLKVLETIPKMMQDEEFRNRLRALTLDFLYRSPKDSISTKNELCKSCGHSRDEHPLSYDVECFKFESPKQSEGKSEVASNSPSGDDIHSKIKKELTK